MRKINIPQLQSMWAGLKMKYPAKVDINTLRDECKRLKISLTAHTMSSYVKSGVLQRLRKGVYIIDSNPQKIVAACDEARNCRKKYSEKQAKVKIFNATVEPVKLTPEIAIKYLKSKGYFIYLPKKGEKITVTFNF